MPVSNFMNSCTFEPFFAIIWAALDVLLILAWYAIACSLCRYITTGRWGG